MLEWLFSWEVTSVIVAICLGVAFAVLAMNDFRLAKTFFLLAAADAAGGVVMWGIKLKGPTWVAAVVVFAVVGGFGALTVIAFRYVNSKRESIEKTQQLPSAISYKPAPDKTLPTPEELAAAFARELAKQGWKAGPADQSHAPTGGFIQFEGKSLLAEDPSWIDNWQPGKVLRMNFQFMNRGTRPVFDVQTWGTFLVVELAKNPGVRLRSVLHKGISEGYKRFSGAGNPLGVGLGGWNTAVGQELTQEQIDGIRNGSLRIHLMLGGAWTDEVGKKQYWISCEWTNWGEVPYAKAIWHDC